MGNKSGQYVQSLGDAKVCPDQPTMVAELLLRILIAGASLRRKGPPAPDPDLSPHLMRAVMFLQANDEVTVGQLADALGISLGRASRIADRFEALGIVNRQRAVEDKRVVILTKTPSARALDERRSKRGEAVALVLEDTPPEHRSAIVHFLRRVAQQYEQIGDEESLAVAARADVETVLTQQPDAVPARYT
jgi:DNA-binding MarR family transcriptional regulator